MLMRNALMVAALVAGMATSGVAAEWQVDGPHSSVQFKVSHLVISKVVGSFSQIAGALEFDGKDLAAGSVAFTIATASVATGNEDRDKHLASGEFFNVAEHPEMTFKSTEVQVGKDGEFKLVGDLTIKGVTKSVVFECEYHGSAAFMGTTKAGFSAKTEIDRTDFGLTWSKALETGGLVVGHEVEIELELEFNQAG